MPNKYVLQSHDGPGDGSQVSGSRTFLRITLHNRWGCSIVFNQVKIVMQEYIVLFILCGFNELLLLFRTSPVPVIENRDSTGTEKALVPRYHIQSFG